MARDPNRNRLQHPPCCSETICEWKNVTLIWGKNILDHSGKYNGNHCESKHPHCDTDILVNWNIHSWNSWIHAPNQLLELNILDNTSVFSCPYQASLYWTSLIETSEKHQRGRGDSTITLFLIDVLGSHPSIRPQWQEVGSWIVD